MTCHGRTAHAQEAAAGRNAIVALSAFVQAATRLPAELPGVLLNVGRITGGGPATNVVPDLAEAVLDVRVTHMTDQAAVEERLRALVAELSTDGITFEISGGINRPPKECNATEAKAFAEWRRAGADLELVPFSWLHAGGGSDGSLLSAAGLPNLDGVGIVGDHMHSEREYCVLSSLVERAQLAALFLHRLASGEIEIGKPS
ncbi:MAG TPA: peptidase dimerization domain-containing protein [Prosthecobacter sp.]